MTYKHKSETGFTLVELLVVIVIISLLSALILGALRTGGIRAKEDSARSFVVRISDSLMELFEELDDQGFTLEQKQFQIPEYKDSAALSPTNSPFGATYRSYEPRINWGDTESAECLYMIMTQTGYFSDFVETLHEQQVANTGGGTSPELIDPWGTAIQVNWEEVTINDNDSPVTLPVVRSAGVDLEHGTNDDIKSIDGNGIFAQ
jgi:prepilin-type N-terminal cleavage/methylation domain-containing protein